MPCDVHIALERGEDAVHARGEGVMIVNVVEIEREFVAAEPADEDVVALELPQLFRHRIDEAVADGMAERIVHRLEIVEVEHGKADGPAPVPDHDRICHQFVEIFAVRQARQPVIAGHVANLVFRFDALRHFLEGDDAKLVAARPRGEFEVATIGQLQEKLAVASFADGLHQFDIGEIGIRRRKQPAGGNAQQQRLQGPVLELRGVLEAERRRRLAVGHHGLAFGAQHDEPVRHGVERAVEALRQIFRVALFRNRREQHRAHVLGHLGDDEHERDDVEAEHEIVEVALEDQPERDRQDAGDGEHRDHALRAVIAPDDGDRPAHDHRNGGEFAERVRDQDDRGEAERARACALNRAANDIGPLRTPRRRHVDDRVRPLHAANGPVSVEGGQEKRHGEPGIDQAFGRAVDEKRDQPLAQATDQQDTRIVEQRSDKADIDILRN